MGPCDKLESYTKPFSPDVELKYQLWNMKKNRWSIRQPAADELPASYANIFLKLTLYFHSYLYETTFAAVLKKPSVVMLIKCIHSAEFNSSTDLSLFHIYVYTKPASYSSAPVILAYTLRWSFTIFLKHPRRIFDFRYEAY